MTKAEKIRKIAKQRPNWSTSRIGQACDCSDSYVRVVLRQRGDGGMSEHDKRWRTNNWQRYLEYSRANHQRRYHSDPEYRERRLRANREAYARRKEREAAHA